VAQEKNQTGSGAKKVWAEAALKGVPGGASKKSDGFLEAKKKGEAREGDG